MRSAGYCFPRDIALASGQPVKPHSTAVDDSGKAHLSLPLEMILLDQKPIVSLVLPALLDDRAVSNIQVSCQASFYNDASQVTQSSFSNLFVMRSGVLRKSHLQEATSRAQAWNDQNQVAYEAPAGLLVDKFSCVYWCPLSSQSPGFSQSSGLFSLKKMKKNHYLPEQKSAPSEIR